MQKNKSENGRVKREFGLSSLSVNNRATVFVLTFIIIISGMVSYISMPKATFPDLVVPQIYVGTPYPGNSPLDMEKLITRPLEKEINTITGVDKITSTSLQGYSTILAEFKFDVTPAEALRKVKDAVDKAKSDPDFPDDLPSEPNVFEVNFSEFPIMNINLSGDYSVDRLKEYGEYLEDEIESLPEISKVEIRGVQDKEVKVEIDLHKMESLEINFSDIENAIRSENITLSGGGILLGDFRRTVRVVGEFKSMKDVAGVIVKREKQDVVYLGDIAEIYFEEEESKSFAREFTKPVVMVDVVKRAGENLISASEKINKIIEEAKASVFPENLEISVTNDQSDKTRSQVNNLENSIISGVILVVLVLLFFLGLRNALFVGIAIPLSMFMAFMILGAMGVTLNLIVLFSLILALGMLVDNGIVVVENIYRLMEEGMPSIEAAKQGVGEVAWPIITSTATTLAAFLPLAFWPGMMGEFMKFLPITLIIVLGSSLFVGLVINPVLTAVFMKAGEEKLNRKRVLMLSATFITIGLLAIFGSYFTIGNLLLIAGFLLVLNLWALAPATVWFQTKLLPLMEEKYQRFLRFTLKKVNPYLFLGGTFLLLLVSFGLIKLFMPKVLFFPESQPVYINIFIEKPIGSDIAVTNEITGEIEDIVLEELQQYNDTITHNGKKEVRNFLVESVIAQVGEGTSDPNQGPSMENTPHKARITVSFVEFQFRRGVNTSDVMEDLRDAVRDIPGVQITVDKSKEGPPRGKAINIEVIGDNYLALLSEAENIKQFIDQSAIEGIEELTLDVEIGKPELPVIIDRNKARRLNLSTHQIATALRTALYGKEVSTYKEGEDDFPIMIRLADKYRYNLDALMNQRITFRDQMSGKIRQVPVSAVAQPVMSSTFSGVKRKNLDRVITIGSNVEEGFNATETVNKIKERMKNYPLPKNIDVKFTGEQEDQEKEMAFLSKALMIAVFMIFLIIVSQFNSAVTPFIIVGSVVFSLIGVLMGLVIFQMDFIIIMTMIGIISLAGVVVNNAIVLIDYTNLLMERKRKELGLKEGESLSVEDMKDCIIDGGKKRLRPVLLTAVTTILGLLPLAVGMNINFFTLLSDYDPQIFFGGDNSVFWGPMSWTVIFGLSFATFLTLVIVPVMYYLKSKLKHKLYA